MPNWHRGDLAAALTRISANDVPPDAESARSDSEAPENCANYFEILALGDVALITPQEELDGLVVMSISMATRMSVAHMYDYATPDRTA